MKLLLCSCFSAVLLCDFPLVFGMEDSNLCELRPVYFNNTDTKKPISLGSASLSKLDIERYKVVFDYYGENYTELGNGLYIDCILYSDLDLLASYTSKAQSEEWINSRNESPRPAR